MAPISWNGSQIIYNKVVRPVFLRHEAMVDNMVNNLGGKAMDAAENLTREGPDPFSSSTDYTPVWSSVWLIIPSFPLSSPDHADEE